MISTATLGFISIWRLAGSDVWLLAGLLPILLSPLALLLIRITLEHGKPHGILSPKTQSWSFLFGDSIALPLAFGAAAYGYIVVPDHSFFSSNLYILISLLTAVVITFFWHKLLDKPQYVRRDSADLLSSPSKLWHDYVVYPTLSAGLMLIGLPVVWYGLYESGYLIILGISVWLVLGIYDSKRQLDPRKLHPDVSTTRLAP